MADLPTVAMETAGDWERWLEVNHRSSPGVWLQRAKKGAGRKTVTYDEALDAALCFGWIDGQRRSADGDHFLQRFTPRRPGSLWSKRNVGKIQELNQAGRLRPQGLVEVVAAQDDDPPGRIPPGPRRASRGGPVFLDLGKNGPVFHRSPPSNR